MTWPARARSVPILMGEPGVQGVDQSRVPNVMRLRQLPSADHGKQEFDIEQ